MLVDALQGHAVWSAVYDDGPNPLLALEQRTIGPWLEQVTGSTVFDIACGTGRWTRFARHRGACAYGFDFCEPMLRAATRARQPVGLADALRLPLRSASGDMAICAFAAGYVSSVARLLCELARVTRLGGAVILSDLHPDALKAGWRRGFRRGTESFEIRHRRYSVDELLLAARIAGLRPESIEERSFGEPERAIFAAAGRAASFDSLCPVPAILAVRWRRA